MLIPESVPRNSLSNRKLLYTDESNNVKFYNLDNNLQASEYYLRQFGVHVTVLKSTTTFLNWNFLNFGNTKRVSLYFWYLGLQ